MSDIFISYAYEDGERVSGLVAALSSVGWSVFWDAKISVGKNWRREIEREVAAARAIVVVWSAESIHSEWVQEEAEEAKRRQILFPIRIDPIQPPFGFTLRQAGDFTKWTGAVDAPEVSRLISVLSDALGSPEPHEVSSIEAEAVSEADLLFGDATPTRDAGVKSASSGKSGLASPVGTAMGVPSGEAKVLSPTLDVARGPALSSLSKSRAAEMFRGRHRTLAALGLGSGVLFAVVALYYSASKPTPPPQQASQGGQKAEAAVSGRKGSVDIDLDEGEAAAAAQDGPMTPDAEAAKSLFEQRRFAEAAAPLFAVVYGEKGDYPRQKQRAEYYLAVSLFEMGYAQASYAIFSVIADNRKHPMFLEALPWLAKLATSVSEAADIVERVGKYSAPEVASLDTVSQRPLFWPSMYLLGRYRMRNRDHAGAIEIFDKIKEESPYFARAQLLMGISYVALKKSIPAVEAFRRASQIPGASGQADGHARVRDLAFLNLARAFYSVSIKLDSQQAAKVEPNRLSLALTYASQVGADSDLRPSADLLRAWAYFMADDAENARSSLRGLQASPEAALLGAAISFDERDVSGTRSQLATFVTKYSRLRAELVSLLSSPPNKEEVEEYFFPLINEDAAGRPKVSEELTELVQPRLSTTQFLETVAYLQQLDQETLRFRRASEAFRRSKLGEQVADVVKLARDLAIRQSGELVLQQLNQLLEELNRQLAEAERMKARL